MESGPASLLLSNIQNTSLIKYYNIDKEYNYDLLRFRPCT